MPDEERLVQIEIKLTRQEDLTQQLSDLVYAQQKQINELQALCKALAQRLRDASDEGPDPYVQERPPHY